MLVAVTGIIAPLCGQSTLEGIVRDRRTGEAVTGAHVWLDQSYQSTWTDAEGRFQFSRITPAKYGVSVSHVAYRQLDTVVMVGERSFFLEIWMDIAPKMSDQFIITAVRSDERSPGAASLITREELRQVNLGQDIPFLLSVSPSVVVTSDAGTGIGYTGIRIRGVDQNRINVTINGVPLNDPESQSVYWVDLPDFASSVEDIQIQRGVGTSTNGAAAFGGSVNIRTEKLNARPYAAMTHAAGSFNTLKNSLSFGTGLMEDKFAFDGRVSRIVSDGFIDRASSSLFSWYLSGGYYGKKTVLKVVVMSGKEVTYQAWGGIPSEILDTNRTWNPQGLFTDANGILRAYENQVDDYRQDHYQLHLMQRLNSRWTSDVALHLTTGIGFYEDYKEDRKLEDFGLPAMIYGNDTITRSDLVKRKWLDNRFYGITWSFLRDSPYGNLTIGGAANLYDGDHFGTLPWLEYPGNIPKDYEWYHGNGNKKDVNIFVKYHRLLSARWMIFADMQVRGIDYSITGIDDDLRDIGQHHDFLFYNPKAGISFIHNESHETYLVLGIANREPNRSNFTDADPDGPVPVEERLFNMESGHKVKYNRLSGQMNGFLMLYKDQLVLTGEINDVGSPVMTNVPESYRAGIEMVCGYKATQWLTWEGNATFSRNRILDFVAWVDDWDTWGQRKEILGETPISFSPFFIGNSIIRVVPFRDFSLALVSQYVSSQYLDNTGSPQRMLDGWLVNNLHLQYSLNLPYIREARINLMLNNILGEKYESNGWVYRYYENGEHKTMDGLFPQAGFHFLAGITLAL